MSILVSVSSEMDYLFSDGHEEIDYIENNVECYFQSEVSNQSNSCISATIQEVK